MKLIATAVIAFLVVLGVLGLLLPIIPGLLFLAIAAVVAASYFPTVERLLGRNRTLARHLDRVRTIWRSRRLD